MVSKSYPIRHASQSVSREMLLPPKIVLSVSTPTIPQRAQARSFSNASSANLAAVLQTPTQVLQMLCGLCVSSNMAKLSERPLLHGLDNMRYTLSSCMFGFPTQKVSLSSPCQVSCTPLSNAIESGLGINATIADLSFCTSANFSTANIQRCVFCYGLMDKQKYLANCMPYLR